MEYETLTAEQIQKVVKGEDISEEFNSDHTATAAADAQMASEIKASAEKASEEEKKDEISTSDTPADASFEEKKDEEGK